MMIGRPKPPCKRHAARGAGDLDAGQRVQAFGAVPHQLRDGGGLREPLAPQRHAHRQHLMRIEPGIDRAQREESANEQRRADQQHERQSHLGDDQQRARLVLPEPAARSAAALLERRRSDRCATNAAPGTGRRRGRSASETIAVNASTRQSTPTPEPSTPMRGMLPGFTASSARMPSDAKRQPEHAAHQRQHDALGQQLPHDPAAAGAHRRADRDLPLADGRAHQQQVRDIRARDQQDEGDRAQQHPQRRPHVADDDLLHRLDAEAALAAQRVGKLLAELVAACCSCAVGRRRA